MFIRLLTTFLLLLFSARSLVFSQEILAGNKLSSSVEEKLAKNGYTLYSQNLSQSGQDEFAYNLILSFPATKKIDDNDENKGERKKLTFSFRQEDFFSHSEDILDFLQYIKDIDRSWNGEILFSVLDDSPLDSENSIKGTEVYASSVDDSDSMAAIAVSFSDGYKAKIHTSGKSHTSPLWLTKDISDAFFNLRKNYSIEDRLSAIYRLGILKGKERLSFFFNNEIPAIELELPLSFQLTPLKEFAKNYNPAESLEWDMHYIYINRGNFFRAVFISERAIIISCLTVGILTLLILCVFSFVGTHGERHKVEFLRSIYIIPFTIAVSFLSITMGQALAAFLSTFLSLNPIIQYGIKIVFSMLFISLLFTVQRLLKFSITVFIYGYILSVISIFNIFLFTTRDLTLFVIFAIEYLITYLAKNSKKLTSSIFFFILMLLPFIPYGIVIVSKAEEAELLKAVFTPPMGNLLLVFAILPFQISWLRLLIFFNIVAGARGYTTKKIILNGLLSTIAILAFISCIICAISHFIYKPQVRAAQKIEKNFKREELFTLSAKISQNEFSGMSTNHIRILSEIPALRYEVTLYGEGSEHPIYDSIYAFKANTSPDGNDSYTFVIPDYPPQSITIDYASDIKAKARIEVTAYYKSREENTFRFEKRELKVE
ncbi:hypothetical protein [uncultured Treponema sp.]|uniref:hypothetical protein n=1 Tax=uncultured Treponema sp. TaxID=162155 RepID=UPI0025F20BA2|nr:hypothetical protein [uncultured Treponema sp.]